jgi:hypothetical protein
MHKLKISPICLVHRGNMEHLPIKNVTIMEGPRHGLTNQLFALVNGVIQKKDSDILVIDAFLNCMELGTLSPISEIIDLKETSEKIRQIPGFKKVRMVDRMDIKNSIQAYSLSNFQPSILDAEIFRNAKCDYAWYSRSNERIFLKLLNSIVFQKDILAIVTYLKNELNINKVNLIQLRVEDDAIEHWSQKNHLTHEEFRVKLFEHYRYLYDRHFQNEMQNLVLTGANQKITDVFYQHQVNKFITVSQDLKTSLLESKLGYSGRELRALLDLLLGLATGVNFIGCHSYFFNRGSSFSWLLAKNMSGKVGLIDIDQINNPPEFFSRGQSFFLLHHRIRRARARIHSGLARLGR